MTQPEATSPSPPPARTTPPTKVPVAGLLVLLISCLGLAAWTGLRISEATKQKALVAEKRVLDSKRQLEALQAVRQVEIVTAAPDVWTPVVEVDGTLVAGQSAALGFKVGGRIAAINVKLGQKIKAGQLLATLDAGEAAAQVSAAQAQVRAAEAGQALAADTDTRTKPLVDSGAVAEAMGVQTSQQMALSSAQLDAARAQLTLAQVALANHRLTAPFGGTITRAPDGPGAVTGPGVPLFEIAELGTLKLQGTVSEQDAPLVPVGATLEIDSEAGKVKGTISTVLAQVDPSTRRVRIEAEVANPDARLRAGTFVRAELRARDGMPVLKLPHEVLRPGTQNEVLAVRGNVLASRRIAFSYGPDGQLLVRHGLSAEERIVFNPKPEDTDGLQVEVTGTAPASDGSLPPASPGESSPAQGPSTRTSEQAP